MDFPYIYRWDGHGRKGQPCKVTARGTKNSIRVEFPDGFVMISSGNAIKRRREVIEREFQTTAGLAL